MAATRKAATVEEYLAQQPEERRKALEKLRSVIRKNLPKGFSEIMAYGMPGYVVPHSRYPKGYHCDPKQPLPFLSFASQKNFVALYHMGLYADPELMKWFMSEYPVEAAGKPDVGKSCVRFKKADQIPLEFVGKLVSKVTPDEWIGIYESKLRR